jgi:hypothetical protein
MLLAEAHRLRCDSGTIFGREVVPEVCSTIETSSLGREVAPARPSGDGAVARLEHGSCRPAPSGDHQVDNAHAQLRGHVDRRRVAAALDDQRLRVQVGQVELELVGAVGRVQRALVTPQAQATKQLAISGPLFSTIATRSLRPMPNRFSVPIVSSMWRRRPACVSAARPGAEIAIASSAPAANSSFKLSCMVSSRCVAAPKPGTRHP